MNDWDTRRAQEDNRIEDGTYRVIETRPPAGDPPPPNRRHTARWAGLGALALFLVTKGKAILFTLLSVFKYSKFLTSGLSMFLMIWTYSLHYGWAYAVGIVLMIAIHEMGHLVFAKAVGMPVSMPLFIPFVGALISMKKAPEDAWQEAVVALGGPFFGLVAGLVALFWGIMNGSQLVMAVAYFSFFMTRFNMIPVSPLDGGRIVTALSPVIWVLGLVLMAIGAWYTFSPILIIVLLLGIYRAKRTWDDRNDPTRALYYRVKPWQRVLVGVAYGLIAGISAWGVYLFVG